MCHTPAPLLPQELIDHIIDDNGLDMSTLMSCSVVCRSFVRPSQARIFSHLNLDCDIRATGRDSVAHFRRLHDILTESPHLVPYITNLSCRRLYSWNSPNELVSILLLLSNIRSINFEPIFWPGLPPDVRIAIRDLCQRSRLSYLGLREVQDIRAESLALMVDAPFLTHLSLTDVKLSAPEDIAHWSLHNRMQLFELRLYDTEDSDIISWLKQGHCLSRLQRLLLSWEPRTTPSAQSVIDRSASSLEDISVIPTYGFACMQSRILSRAGITSLRSITVHVFLHGPSFVSWLVKFLQSHNSPRTFRTITLNIFASGISTPPDCDKLVRFLKGDKFPAIRTVEFVFTEDFSSPLLPAIVAAAEAAFVRLAARGVFKCSQL
ncbi:hypothetical protein MVEN_01730700 [Mycena venus]|uniref:F-box domain-containing protein n=1 Tax=Mycena venus TaxID=2733690 RepID=A0A8H6XM43_9AGAR|nr:hypothetical protein MVEN_01730700 [Mycena venus]